MKAAEVTPGRGVRRRARHRTSAALAAGIVLTAAIIAAAVFAPLISPYSPTEQHLESGLLPPSTAHWFGADQLGRDIFTRVLYAARTDLTLAVGAAITPFVIGVCWGLCSGYFGARLRGAVGWTSARITDTVIAFPFYVIVIAIVFAVGAGERGIVLAFALVGWVGYARVLGAMTAALRDAEWVRAAYGGGLSHGRVLLRHVLPNVLPQAIVLLATEIVLIMVAIVTLGYLGLGIRPPTPDWGTMIADGQPFITSHWWVPAMPGIAVVLTGIAFSLLGDGLGDLMRVSPGRAPGAAQTVQTLRWWAPWRAWSRRDRGGAAPGGPPEALPPGRVEVDGLVIRDRSGARLVDGLCLSAEPGEAIGLVGESGSGKSLTLRALLGLMPATTQISEGSAHAGGRVAMVFQNPLSALDPLTRVGDQLRAAVRAAGCSAGRASGAGRRDDVRGSLAERVRQLLLDVGLPEAGRIARAYPHQLSGGQRQRIVIALALASDPDVLLCDEPTTALDVTVQRQVLALLTRLRRERGLTLVFVSHDLAVVAQMCEQIVVLRRGALVESGSTAVVVHDPQQPYTRELIAALPELPLPLPGAAPSGAAAPEPAARPVLEAVDVHVRYGHAVAVRGVSFALAAGEALGIVGESGSGKTTLARALVGQLPTSGGQMLLDRDPLPRHRNAALRRDIQLVPQDPAASLNPRMTVGALLAELTGRARVGELLERVRLDAGLAASYPYELSGGQRQRVALARALAVQPRVLIADEPTSALDVAVQAQILDLLHTLRRELGLALVFVSHDLAVVHAVCDRVVVMRDGEVIEQGGRDFFTYPAHDYSQRLLAAVPRLPAQASY